HEPVDPLEQYMSAIIDMVNYYSANKELTGEVEAFEEYISLFKKVNCGKSRAPKETAKRGGQPQTICFSKKLFHTHN
ncbi:MAG: hypothetical protein II744_01705, partial [Eubacterium sp.]|nr:hypothetical protein [Eubacterium sp.]